MIERIGLIYQDAISFGFLKGLMTRLKCAATLISPPTQVGKSQHLTRKQAKIAWAFFDKKGVDLVVRFTDADKDRWQEVQRQEVSAFPEKARAMVVCGVAVNDPEDWLAIDRSYISRKLDIPESELADSGHRTDRIKKAIARMRSPDEYTSDLVARIVSQAPREVFCRWLKKDSALRSFYDDSRFARQLRGPKRTRGLKRQRRRAPGRFITRFSAFAEAMWSSSTSSSTAYLSMPSR